MTPPSTEESGLCPVCGGEGVVPSRSLFDDICPVCDGTGENWNEELENYEFEDKP